MPTKQSRRGFLRSALAAVAGAAAGAMMPKKTVEEILPVLKYDPNSSGGPITYKLLEWIEDDECPEDVIYFINRDVWFSRRESMGAMKV